MKTTTIDKNYPGLKKSHDMFFGDCYIFQGSMEINGSLSVETDLPLIVEGGPESQRGPESHEC